MQQLLTIIFGVTAIATLATPTLAESKAAIEPSTAIFASYRQVGNAIATDSYSQVCDDKDGKSPCPQ
ncbi:MAG: hypothetical protein F6K45_03405 [Kamptonema sp. SIO1D9]|nr:hypothetical protein [Kamptonema sp. SIO1D9]